LARDDMQASLSSFFKKKEATTANGPASDDVAAHSAATPTAATAPKRKLPASLQSPPTPAASAPLAVAPVVTAPAAAAPAAPAAPATKPKDLDPVKPAPLEPAAVWMWQSGPSWTPYDPEQSALLERAWTANEPRAPLDKTRHVDFHTMRQAPGAHA
jgi:hypothetical protein